MVWAGWLLQCLSPVKHILGTDAYYVFLLPYDASNKARMEYVIRMIASKKPATFQKTDPGSSHRQAPRTQPPLLGGFGDQGA